VNENGQSHIASERRHDATQGQRRPGRWAASVRDALAIYITVLLIVTVAVAQVLYWKLVIARESSAGDEPVPADEPVLVGAD
jgi:hypothetical protein